MNTPTLQFLGGAGTVTGSQYLVKIGGRQILLDCGLFQGLKELRLRNWRLPPYEPAQIDAILLSHAHIDHSGYLPLVARRGFRGPIYATPATRSLLKIMLPDAAHLQEEEAEYANRKGYSKHHPAEPLYDSGDAFRALKLVKARPYGEAFEVADGITVKFRRTGHILGAASIELRISGTQPVTLVFSGDLGRWNRPMLYDPEFVTEADVLLVESTYGNRNHPQEDIATALAKIVNAAVARGGALLIPAFAVGRTQELIWWLRELEHANKIPSLPIYIDSPMAAHVTDVLSNHSEDHDLEMQQLVLKERSPFCHPTYEIVRTAQESKDLNEKQGPMIIIAGSGMATGGRIVHHLQHRLADERTTVLLVGFQAVGTRGRSLKDGAKYLRMHGRDIPVRAHIASLDGLSAHADQSEILRWLDGFRKPPRKVYLVHGEPTAAETLAAKLHETKGWDAEVARDGQTVSLLG